MSKTNLDNLSDSELCEIFVSAEKFNVFDSLFYEAITECWQHFQAIGKPEKVEFLRAVQSDWLNAHDYE